ncbi:unnamed protein product [Aphanomyces euteiches]
METQPEDQSAPPGLTLGYLKLFIEIHGGRESFRGVSTQEVCSKFLLPSTASTKLSLVDHLRQQPDGHLYVKRAEWFVSHAWSYYYLDVVDALDDFFQDDSTAVWLCTFCNNQHEVDGKVHSFEHWYGIFRNALRAIGKVVMVMSPWNNPTTLTRTWCVFEVYAAVVENAQFEIALNKSQKCLFLQDIQGDGAFQKMLVTVKSENSNTSIPSDRDNIFQLIRDQVGFAELDRIVFEAIEKWMQRMVDQEIDETSTALDKADWMMIKGRFLDDKGQFAEAAKIFQTCLEIYRQVKGKSSAQALKALTHWTAMEMLQGHPPNEAEAKFLQILTQQIDLLSKDHVDTLTTMHLVGHCYFRQGKYDQALPVLLECFDRRNALLGEENQLTRDTMALIGMVYGHLSRLEESIEWCSRCYEIQRRAMGEDHPATNRLRNNLGVAYSLIGDYSFAIKYFQECYDSDRRTFGPLHTATLSAQANLGNIYRLQGKYAEAEKILLDCLSKEDYDQFTKPSSKRYLGMVYLCTGDYERATTYYTEALELLEEVYGRDHDIYALSLFPMYILKMKTGRFDHLDELEAFESVLRDARWDQDSWKLMVCFGCREKIQGVLCACSECPVHSYRYCRSCVVAGKPASFCNHGLDMIEAIQPPPRYVKEKRLQVLAKLSKWNEYDEAFKAYQEYCQVNQVPADEQVDKHPTLKLETAQEYIAPSP